MQKNVQTIPRGRLDALTDGVFAFAMTLLVINVELPDDFHPKSTAELLDGLVALRDTLLAYVVTFLVLGIFWLNRAAARGEPEEGGRSYSWAVLAHLFFVTLMPFSMVVLSRFDLAPAVWLYNANMIMLALRAAGIVTAAGPSQRAPMLERGYVEIGTLIVSAVLAMVIAVFSPGDAMLAYLLNFAAPLMRHMLTRRKSGGLPY